MIRPRLTFESLEQRRCLAANVTSFGNLNTNNPFGDFSDAASAGDYAYLVDRQQLIRTDGTQAGTLALIDLGNAPVPQFTYFNGVMYFQGFDATYGFELWRSDGTVAGTSLVKDLSNHPTDKTIGSLRVFSNRLYFTSDGELFSTDGTATGTSQVINLVANGPDNVANVTVHNSALYFSANSRLYKSDGTSSGTAAVPASQLGSYSLLTSTPGSLYFNSSGLRRLDDTTGEISVIGPAASSLAAVDGRIFFSSGDSLYVTDGTALGTHNLQHVGGMPGNLTNFQGTLYFTGGDNVYGSDFYGPGNELWRSDGTEPGTVLIKDIEPRTRFESGRQIGEDSNPHRFTVFNNQLYFITSSSAGESSIANGLWKTDGTNVGTVQVYRGVIRAFTHHEDQLIIGADSVVGLGDQLLKINVSDQATEIKQSGTGTDSFSGSGAVLLNGQHYLFGNTGQFGRELYRLNADNTLTLVRDVTPGPGFTNFILGAVIGNLFYFVAGPAGERVTLYRTDGTEAGTIRLGTFRQVYSIVSAGNQTYLVADSGAQFGAELWKTNGTMGGTVLLKDIAPGYDAGGIPKPSSPRDLVEFNGKLYFTAEIGNQRRIWSSDGTEAGTKLTINYQLSNVPNGPPQLQIYQGQLYFPARVDGFWKLHRSPGTHTGTTALSTLFQSIGQMAVEGSTLYFAAKTNAYGTELWKVTGSGSPQLVKDIHPGSSSSNPSNFVSMNGQLYFNAFHPATGIELWQSDGTPSGTYLVADIAVGSDNSYATVLGSLGGVLFFRARDTAHGFEIWQTNGSANGATLVQDIWPGSNSSFPTGLFIRGQQALFSAITPEHGNELWSVRSSAPVLTLPAVAASAYRESGPVRVAPAALLDDSDTAVMLGAVLKVSLGTSHRRGDQVLIVGTNNVTIHQFNVLVGGTAVGTFTATGDGRELTVSFNSNATRSRVREVLRAIAFNHLTTSPFPGQRSLRFDLTDGSSGVATARVVRIDVIPFDSLPSISGLSSGATSTLSSTGYAFAATAVVTDDNFNLAGGELEVHFNNSRDYTRILISLGGPTFWKDDLNRVYKGSVVIGTMNAGGGIGATPLRITFNEKVTPALAQALLRSLKVSTPGSTTPGVRIPWMRISDGTQGFSDPVTHPYINIDAWT